MFTFTALFTFFFLLFLFVFLDDEEGAFVSSMPGCSFMSATWYKSCLVGWFKSRLESIQDDVPDDWPITTFLVSAGWFSWLSVASLVILLLPEPDSLDPWLAWYWRGVVDLGNLSHLGPLFVCPFLVFRSAAAPTPATHHRHPPPARSRPKQVGTVPC